MSIFAPLQYKSARTTSPVRQRTTVVQASRGVEPQKTSTISDPGRSPDQQHPLRYSFARIPIETPVQNTAYTFENHQGNRTGLPDSRKGGIENLSQFPIQAKLVVGPVNDIYEQEANQIADQVIRMSVPSTDQQASQLEKVDEEEKDKIHRKPAVQRATTDAGFKASLNIESQIAADKGSGKPLPQSIRSFMEPRFRVDFSNVMVHTDAEGDKLNRSLSARAFTYGQDIFFRRGEYSPESSTGQRLLAHELTHVVQQNHSDTTKTHRALLKSRVKQTSQASIQRATDEQIAAAKKKADADFPNMVADYFAGNFLTNHIEAESPKVVEASAKGKKSKEKAASGQAFQKQAGRIMGTGWGTAQKPIGKNTLILDQGGVQTKMLMRAVNVAQVDELATGVPSRWIEFYTENKVRYVTYETNKEGETKLTAQGKGQAHLGARFEGGRYKIDHLSPFIH